jgi:exodeoxyribonuclease III
MIIATWNVNSITVRLDQALAWLEKVQPNVLCLQETKTIDEKFPEAAFAAIGYQSYYHGEKAYNGVALLSNLPVENLMRGFDHESHADSRRFIGATIGGVQILNCYIPNGQAVGSEKYLYKLNWLKALNNHIGSNCKNADQVLLCGDFNIAPHDIDVYDAAAYGGEIMCSAAERQALEEIRLWGFVDAYRKCDQETGKFSWWDYRAGAFRRNLGFRIDHIWVTESLAQLCIKAWVDKEPRKLERPSDHAPVVAEFAK